MLRRNTLPTNSRSTRSIPRYSFRLIYIFSYNLFQFCGHTWILANTIARFFTFGKDALADTFYSVGFVMSLCQLLSILEIFHIADGIERARLLPRFIQVMEKNILLMMVIMLEEIQSTPVVCVQFFLWNIMDLLRYPHELLSVMERPSIAMLWSRYSLWIPVYILSVANEGVIVYQALPYLEQSASRSAYIHLPFLMMLYLSLLTVGAPVTVWQLLKERKHHLDKWYKRKKKK
ncbi:very-long-chain (3R)-3-hydroxyacyl-CoA dehydratase 4 isoform X1 [Fundulus heteroclitus]|uniref:very-long-chain (3R)-3-hydroxyacyl-CoA dehydratase 4 isoform X1 n=1 Tax=Fundulus heteroclitus TaxID=8078 RepID=UPI00165BF325|nr:very-long-chain (3R)-3-hydroxyacyl-CoA dehydratase 4 isoform X1 [Fundulus heteroclitus]XP_036002010.1 very-long-chain (3R)-3-hydroxyacyl-CoA dehydratase 4 isoform X1 [Fundulus heteroclitus]